MAVQHGINILYLLVIQLIANLMAIDENTAWICGIDGGSGGSKVLKTSDGGQKLGFTNRGSVRPEFQLGKFCSLLE
ncbi:MAG: hypothetical protein IPN10_09860 [Saprospiraceae bacterium]|nr:hypothetical protein [Saprospiraceae bacterium]